VDSLLPGVPSTLLGHPVVEAEDGDVSGFLAIKVLKFSA
jgi:hypothetical protein